MKRSQIIPNSQGSKDAFYIVAHAKFQKNRGKNPSEPYKRELNPRKALVIALAELRSQERRSGNKPTFQVTIGLKEIGEFSKFTDAFKLFYSKIIEQIKQGTNAQFLETSNFIVYQRKGFTMAMGFYDARDFAYDIGLLAGRGEIQNNTEEPSNEVIENAYQKIATEYFQSEQEELAGILRNILVRLKSVLN
jgi:hypothetical protein